MADVVEVKYVSSEALNRFWTNLNTEFLPKKVDKVEGKGLSTNDFTDELLNKLNGIAEGANNYEHPTSGVEAGTYRSVTVDANGHVTAGTNPTTLAEYGITSVEADKITGVINIENLPAGALERIYPVENEAAMLALTADDIQNGDTVKLNDTGVMYFVKNDTLLAGSDDGSGGTRETADMGAFEVYTAGSATSVPWSGVTGKPEAFTPEAHTHVVADVTDFPTAMKNPNALTIMVNGEEKVVYDGSEAKSLSLTASDLGITFMTEAEVDAMMGVTASA